MNKIQFYRERNFGEKVSVTFEFLSQNLRYIWRYLLYVIAPIGVVTGLAINWMYAVLVNITGNGTATDSDYITIGATAIILFLISLVGYVALFSMLYSLMQAYNDRENGLERITYDDLRPYMKINVRRMIIYMLAFIPIGIVIMLIFILPTITFGVFGFLLAFVLLFIFATTYQLVMPVYLNEDISFIGAVQRGMSLAWNTFGGVALLLSVFLFIGYVATSLLSIPWAICYVVKMVFLTAGEASSVASSPLFNVLSYVFAVIMSMGSIAAYIPLAVAMNYQYSNAAEQVDNFSVEDEINDFEKL